MSNKAAGAVPPASGLGAQAPIGSDVRDERLHPGKTDTQKARQKAGAATDKVREGAREAADEVKREAQGLGERTREHATSFASEQREHFADRIRHYGSTFRRTAEQLREDEDPSLAGYAEQCAERVDSVADYVGNRGLSEIVDDAATFTRRHPEVVCGAMLAIGFAVGRSVRASRSHDDGYEEGRLYPDDDYGYEDDAFEEERYGVPGSSGLAPAYETGAVE